MDTVIFDFDQVSLITKDFTIFRTVHHWIVNVKIIFQSAIFPQ